MQLPKEIIDLAIAGGWSNPDYVDTDGDETVELAMHYWQDTCLSPTFWQALGKVLGWPEIKMLNMQRGHEQSEIYWLYVAHRFYDLILQNQPTDAFWDEILTKSK